MRYGVSASAVHLMRAGKRSAWTFCNLRPISIVERPASDPPRVLPLCSTCWPDADVDDTRLGPDGQWRTLRGPRMQEVHEACRWLDAQYNDSVERHNDRRRTGEIP